MVMGMNGRAVTIAFIVRLVSQIAGEQMGREMCRNLNKSTKVSVGEQGVILQINE